MDEKSPKSAAASLRGQAQQVYGRALADVGPDGHVDVEALAAAHPEMAMELRIAHESWRQVSDIYSELGREPELNRTLEVRKRLEELSQRASLPQRMMKQLEVHTPKTSRYEVQGEVARGGMGAILKVWDSDLRRPLAMKVIKNGPKVKNGTATPEEEKPLTRFLEEAQVTSQLDHPGVVPVHELGLDDDGQVYFTMRLVRGRDLEHIIDLAQEGKEGWTRTRLIQVLLKVCEALAYAHSKGVLHRDLKPANIMVGRFGEVYVMDWGLAHVLDEEGGEKADSATELGDSVDFVHTDRHEFKGAEGESIYATLDGDVVGTPSYMSPEQAKGKVAELDKRSDVYSLGAILYHVLAGHLPFVPPGTKINALGILRKAQACDLEPIAERAPDAPGELIAICEKAMAPRPKDRYESAVAVAEDLQSFLEDRVVRAYEAGAVAEIRKWVKRNRGVAAACLGAVLATVGALAAVAWVETRANAALETKNDELAEANRVATRNEQRALEEKERADENARLAEARSVEADAARVAAEASAREARIQRDVSDRVTDFMIGLFESPTPEVAVGEILTAKQLLDRGASSIVGELGADPLVQAALMSAMGRAYQSLGEYPDAETLLVGALDRRRELLDEDDRSRLESELALALLRRWQGRFDEADELYASALERAEAEFGDYDGLTHRAWHEQGLLRYFQGDYERAEELLQRAYDSRSEELGEEHPDALESLGALALLYRKQAQYERAEEYFADVLDARADALGDDHPDTLLSKSNLASVLMLEERFDEAEILFGEVLEARDRVLGEDHPETLISMSDLGHLLVKDRRVREAERIYRDALERHRRVLGDEHPFTLTVLNNLAALLQQQGRIEEAEPLLVSALRASRAVHGDVHETTVSLLNGLASVYLEQELFADATETYREALELGRKLFAPDHPNTLVVLENLVQVLQRSEELEEAETEARELLLLTPREDATYRRRSRLLEEIRSQLEEGSRDG